MGTSMYCQMQGSLTETRIQWKQKKGTSCVSISIIKPYSAYCCEMKCNLKMHLKKFLLCASPLNPPKTLTLSPPAILEKKCPGHQQLLRLCLKTDMIEKIAFFTLKEAFWYKANHISFFKATCSLFRTILT